MRLISPHTLIPVMVTDQNKALRFYTKVLECEVRTDISYAPGLRLVTVAFPDQSRPELALAQPGCIWHGEERVQELLQKGRYRRPWLIVTDRCQEMYEQLSLRGVTFVQQPETHLYGIEALFRDPFGNAFSLLELAADMRPFFEGHLCWHAA